MKKRFLASVLATLMLLSMLPTGAFAAADDATIAPQQMVNDGMAQTPVVQTGDDTSNSNIYLDPITGNDTKDGKTVENAVKTLTKAFEIADDGGTIYLLSDMVLPSETVLSGDKSITLAGNAGESAPTIKYSDDGSKTNNLYMIEIGAESGTSTQTNITLRNLTIDAEAQDIRCLRVCSGSQLILSDGATVCNGKAVNQDGTTGTSDWGGGIVVDNGAKLTMEDGSSITGCSAEWGGAVYLSGEMEINGGEITNNTAVGDIYNINGVDRSASAHGGAIMIRACRADYDTAYTAPAKLTMRGGSISGNAATSDVSAFGGAIAIIGTPDTGDLTNTFVMSGGTISGNKAGFGGAVSAYAADNYWQGSASIQLSGDAQITDNAARNYGGAICLFGNNTQNFTNTLEMSGGTISDNKANSYGGGVYLSANGDQFYMTGGSIRKNEAGYGGGVSIRSGNSSTNIKATAYLLGGTISGNQAKNGYPTNDSYSERLYCGNAVDQNGNLYLDGTKADISGDIRIGCTIDYRTNAIETNHYVTLVGASDSMKNYQLTSEDEESLDGRAVVVPGTVTYNGTAYTVSDAEPYAKHFSHNHKQIITNTEYTAQVSSGTSSENSLVLYGKNPVEITPMDITIYIGGNGYDGIIGADGEFSSNDLPEVGFYLTLPDDLNKALGGTADTPVNLSGKVSLSYNNGARSTTRNWTLALYGDEDHSKATINGQQVYIYRLLPSKIDDTEETIPLRMQFTDAAGNVMVDSEFPVSKSDQFRNYTVSFYSGDFDPELYSLTVESNGKTLSFPIELKTGTLKVRGNTDETYRDIQDSASLTVNPQEKDICLAATNQSDTQYFVNNSGISADPTDVKLLVDHSLDDALLTAYLNQNHNADGQYTYQFRYLDLVDTSNGNAYVTMGAGQSMDIYWPVPSDAKTDSNFRIVHFQGLDRESNADISDLLTTEIPAELACEKVTIDGQQFIKFTTGSFSPFALLYEKAAPSGGGSSGGGGSSSSSKYTLHYESNGGTSYKDESYSSGTTVTLDKAPTRESYTFTGWYADKALTNKITNVKMTGNKTVYAGWTATDVPDMLNGDDHYAYVVGYSDGTVRPDANISRAEVATIFFRLLKEEVRDSNLTTENTFADVTNGQWHNKAISTMAKLGVVKGRNAEAFDPDAPITRAEFATICARFDKTQISTDSNFTDISGHWAEKYIERAATLGWIAGYSDGTFRPNNYITRAEAMTMINRVLRRMPQSADDLLENMTIWPDNKPTDWHYLAVQEATNSHDFDRKGEVNEKWTKLTNGSDWRQYQ